MAQTVRNGAPELLERNDLDMVWIEIAAACRGTVKEFVKAARSCSNPQSGEPVDRLKFEEGTFRIQDRRGNFPLVSCMRKVPSSVLYSESSLFEF